ncbi:MAG TPA: DUF3606 domain-containing protein [Flavisolibacter sp.]
MADNKNIRDGRDRSRVDANEDYELRHIAEKHGVSIEEVKKVVGRVGNSREKVEEELRSSNRRR